VHFDVDDSVVMCLLLSFKSSGPHFVLSVGTDAHLWFYKTRVRIDAGFE
jgi:hypothetical protein